MLTFALMLTTADPLLESAIREAIEDEIQLGLEATIDQDIERYMAHIPEDTRIVENDGSITDRAALREAQLQAWAIIPRTNRIEMNITDIEIGCDGECATVWTDQLWDRQMLGRDGEAEFNVVTTQLHRERWEQRNSRWINVETEELGQTITVDGEPYN